MDINNIKNNKVKLTEESTLLMLQSNILIENQNQNSQTNNKLNEQSINSISYPTRNLDENPTKKMRIEIINENKEIKEKKD